MNINIVNLKNIVAQKLNGYYVTMPDGRIITADEKSRLRLFSASQMLQRMEQLVAAGLVPEPITDLKWIAHNKDIVTLTLEEIDYILAAAMLFHYNLKMAEIEAITLGHIPEGSMLNPTLEEEPAAEE